MTLGRVLKDARVGLGLTLDAVAIAAKTSKSYVHDLEADRCEPGLSLAARLSVVLGVPVTVMAALVMATHKTDGNSSRR